MERIKHKIFLKMKDKKYKEKCFKAIR